jgi:hypothetical protein
MNTICVGILIIVFLFIYMFSPFKTIENFDSLTTCMDQGYPKDWCMQTPLQSDLGSAYCNCANGRLGSYHMNGKCYCYPFNPTFPYYTDKIFHDYLG